MMELVQKYLDGGLDRPGFDLDFGRYLDKHYAKMERESGELADCFLFYLSEEGVDQTDGMPDGEHKKLIRRQFDEFKEALSSDIL